MRNLTMVCAGLALVGGVVSVQLWRELRAERELTAQLRSEVGSLRAGVLLPPVPASQGNFQQHSAADMARAGAPDPVPQAVVANTIDGQLPPTAATPRILVDQRELMKDPEYRKARLAQTRASLPRNYPGLVEDLGLSPEEADRLFDLLAENQMDASSAILPIQARTDPSMQEEFARTRQELQRKQEQELLAQLGSSRYAQWQEYQETRGARQEVMQLGLALQSAGAPMSPDQSRPLISAYAAEQRRQADELRRLYGASGPLSQPDQQRVMEERLRLQTEGNRRLLDAARPHMSARQLEALQDSLEQQLAVIRASNRMRELQQQAPAQNAAPGTAVVTLPAGVPF